jgi:hypothetical protein
MRLETIADFAPKLFKLGVAGGAVLIGPVSSQIPC